MTTQSEVRRVQMKWGSEDLILETGLMAKQADGSVMVTYGGSVVLVSAVVSKGVRDGIDFLPLTVEYQEKTYAAGKIPGGFFKREGRPSEKEILTSRLIDRPVRSLFPKGFRNDVQIVALVLSHDGKNDPDMLAMVGASTALGLAASPVQHRLGVCRVGRVEGNFILNPTLEELTKSDLDVVVASTEEGIIMVESGAKQVSEEVMVEALRFGQEHGSQTVALQKELISACSPEPREFETYGPDAALIDQVEAKAKDKISALLEARVSKEGGGSGQKELVAELLTQLQTPEETLTEADLEEAISKIEQKIIRRKIHAENRRMDGRDLTTVRDISCEVGLLPRTHGSGLFTRGQTQSLCCATLGTSTDEQIIDALTGKWFKSFMLHYNFPPFSVGEARPMRGPGRREIGHGALAYRAMQAVLPTKEEFPYTVRVVSEILESNGSSSMATVCSTTLALMDAGVPIKGPVAGIAMGLIREENKHTVLTDIIGLEDHYGDMDFKVAGTREGITALQLDLKLTGVPLEVLQTALKQAHPARMLILEKIQERIASPRTDLSPFAPRITLIKIDTEKIGELIGPGGKMIRRIIAETGADINVEDDGTVMVASADAAASQKAVEFIKGLTSNPEIGKVYQGVVKRVMNFGAFLEITPGKEGLCHVSELQEGFVPKVEDVVKLGDTLAVKVVEIDSQGRINLSHKQAASPDAAPVPPAKRGGPDRRPDSRGRSEGGRGGFRSGGRDRDRGRGPDRGPDRGPRDRHASSSGRQGSAPRRGGESRGFRERSPERF